MSRELERRRQAEIQRLQEELWRWEQSMQQHPPPMPQYPVYPQYPPEYERYPQPRFGPDRPRGRRRKDRYISGPAKVLAIFLFSWVWCGVGLPGMTLVTWAFGACFLMNRAFRER